MRIDKWWRNSWNGNRLEALPVEIGKLTALTVLNVSDSFAGDGRLVKCRMLTDASAIS